MKGSVHARRRKVAKYFVDHELTGIDGFKEALRAAEFHPLYVRNEGKRLFESPSFVQYIAEERGKLEYTKEKAIKLLTDLKADCKTMKDRTNRLGCIKELNRIHGLYSDEDSGVTINQIIVSPQERKQVLIKELDLLKDIESAPLCIAE